MKEKVYIIGAGLAGLSAAHHLNKQGYKDIEIFEASPFAGGRCRSFYDEKLGAEIDNGNHLILGANTSVLSLIKELGVLDKFNKFDDKVFTFFNNRKGERYHYKAPFPDIEVYGISGFLNFLKFMIMPAATVKQAFRLTPKFYEEIINPISRSILNTPSEAADANILRNVFWKIVTNKNGFDYYYPKKNWHDALIAPLTEHLEKNGVKINYPMAVKRIQSSEFRVQKLVFDENEIDVSEAKVILAVPPQVACKLADIITPDEFYPIINIHFKVEHILQPQIFGVIESNIEWVFVKPGIISTTFSAAAEKLNEADMVKEAWNVCYKVLGLKGDMPPHLVLTEKRATFACTKEQLKKRPQSKTEYNNLFLAGDYTITGLPATIEGAVVSGELVARN